MSHCPNSFQLSLRDVSSSIRVLFIVALLILAPRAQATSYTLGTTAIIVGPFAGSDSVTVAVTPLTDSWTATTNAPWLHLSPANQSGTGGTNVVFSFDQNSGAPRSGTLTIGGQTVTVTQAGLTYSPASGPIAIVSAGLSQPNGIALDGAGNVYIADTIHNSIKKWTRANNSVSLLASNTFGFPSAVGADSAGNAYFCLNGFNLSEWVASSQTIIGLGGGVFNPENMVVNAAGVIYIADSDNHAVETWSGGLQTLVSLNRPSGVSVDVAGNVFISDSTSNAVFRWTPSSGVLTRLVQGLNQPHCVAVDGSGNIFIADTFNSALRQRSAINGTVFTPFTGLEEPSGVAVDSAGNVFVSDVAANIVYEVPRAYVDMGGKFEGADARTDSVTVLPATVNLLPPFAPTSTQPWLTITGVANGIVSFSVASNFGSSRLANINVLGRSVTVTQSGATFALGTTGRLVGPTAGSDSVVLAAKPLNVPWTASTNVSWLHLSPANQSGNGSANVIFSYDANPGPTRTGTLSIAGQTLTVTQAGATYVPAQILSVLVASNLNNPEGVGVDNAGNVYIADTGNNAIERWNVADQTVSNALSGLYQPGDVTFDGAGNLYIADTYNDLIKRLPPGSLTPVTVVSNGMQAPFGIAVDPAGAIYIADTYQNTIKKWSPGNASPSALFTNVLNNPYAVAVDAAGNVYFTDSGNNAVKKWNPATGTVSNLITSNIDFPEGIAVDGAGNVYVANSYAHSILQWNAANNTVSTLFSNQSEPRGLELDANGNIYFASYGTQTVREGAYAFVDISTRFESADSGSDVLPVILPATENLLPPFAPTSDQPWLTFNGATNGIVSFSFGPNPGGVRTAHLTVLGQEVSITQTVGTNYLNTNTVTETAETGSDSVYLTSTPDVSTWTATANAPWLHLAPGSQSGMGSTNVVFTFDPNTGSQRSGTLTIASNTLTVIQSGTTNFLFTNSITVDARLGTNSVTLTEIPTVAPWTAVANDSWLRPAPGYQSGVGSTNVVFAFDLNPGSTRVGTIKIASNILTVTQGVFSYSLGTTNILEGPTAGNDTIVLGVFPSPGIWAAAANAPWLHLDPGYQSGAASTNVLFHYDANPGATRAGTLTIAGKTVTVTQAGSNYVTTPFLLTPLSSPATNGILRVQVDDAGDVYWLNDGAQLFKYVPASNQIVQVAQAVIDPYNLALDASGNAYFITGNGPTSTILEWIAASNQVTTVFSSTEYQPAALAIDRQSNIFFLDYNDGAVKRIVSTETAEIVSPPGTFTNTLHMALDAAGNFYAPGLAGQAITEWIASTGTTTNLVTGLMAAFDVAVDGAGNVYFFDLGNNQIGKWTAASGTVTPLKTVYGGGISSGIAVDGGGNIYTVNYAAYTNSSTMVVEAARAFIDPRDKAESSTAGSDTLPVVLPVTASLSGPFTPGSEQPWLRIDGITNGVLHFSYDAFSGTGANRIGYLEVLGQPVAVIQGTTNFSLGMANVVEGPAAGSESVVLGVVPNNAAWTAVANNSWLHINPANQSGVGSVNVGFSFDANPGITRTGSLTIAGQNLAVTQAGANYIQAPYPVSTLVPGIAPYQPRLDAAGNVYYVAGSGVYEWIAASNQVVPFAVGVPYPSGLAADPAGNVYILSFTNNTAAILKWVAASNTLTQVPTPAINPNLLAVDGRGNLYILDGLDYSVRVISANSGALGTAVPAGVLWQAVAFTVDVAGNIYAANSNGQSVVEWVAAAGTLTNLATGFTYVQDMAVDGSGNVYISDNGATLKWTRTTRSLTTLPVTGTGYPLAVAVDAAGNIIVGYYTPSEIIEGLRVFVDPTPKTVGISGGTGSLPVILPSTENVMAPSAPTNDQPWLSIIGMTNGTVYYSFTATTTNRSAHINLLGQTISILQAINAVTPPRITGVQLLAKGVIQFGFTNVAGATFTVFSATNPAQPLNQWQAIGSASNVGPEIYQFVDPHATNSTRFYMLRSP
jgi:sugar lactone lactonase YvrE